MKLVVTFLLLCTLAVAQDTLVVPVTPDEAAQATSLYNAKLVAEAAWVDFQSQLASKYTQQSGGIALLEPPGVTFSKDFHFLIYSYTLSWHQSDEEYEFGRVPSFTMPSITPGQSKCWMENGTWRCQLSNEALPCPSASTYGFTFRDEVQP